MKPKRSPKDEQALRKLISLRTKEAMARPEVRARHLAGIAGWKTRASTEEAQREKEQRENAEFAEWAVKYPHRSEVMIQCGVPFDILALEVFERLKG